jgi:hypothetical protein
MSLNAVLNQDLLFAYLGVKTLTRDLPTSATCPMCQLSRIYIVDDYLQEGPWYYCEGCLSAGTLLTLARNTLKLADEELLPQLASQGILPRKLSARVQRSQVVADKRDKVRSFIQNCVKSYADNSRHLGLLLERLGVDVDVTTGWYEKSLPPLLGYLEDVQALAPISSSTAVAIKKCGVKNGGAIVLPLQDLPLRYSGAVIYPDNEPNRSFILSVHPDDFRGVFAHPSQVVQKFEKMAVLTDPLLALRLIADETIRSCDVPRVWADVSTSTERVDTLVWNKPVFIGHNTAAEALGKAVQYDAPTAFLPRVFDKKRNLANCFRSTLVRNTASWPNTFRQLASGKTSEEVLDLVSDMRMTKTTVARLASHPDCGARPVHKELKKLSTFKKQLFSVDFPSMGYNHVENAFYTATEVFDLGGIREVVCRDDDCPYRFGDYGDDYNAIKKLLLLPTEFHEVFCAVLTQAVSEWCLDYSADTYFSGDAANYYLDFVLDALSIHENTHKRHRVPTKTGDVMRIVTGMDKLRLAELSISNKGFCVETSDTFQPIKPRCLRKTAHNFLKFVAANRSNSVEAIRYAYVAAVARTVRLYKRRKAMPPVLKNLPSDKELFMRYTGLNFAKNSAI